MSLSLPGPAGSRLFFEPSSTVPIVHLSLSLRTGGATDPAGREGLARLTTRMLRMGTRRLSAEAVEDRIDALGAHLGVSTGLSYTHVAGTVVARNVEPFFALVSELLREPAFRTRDVKQLKRETAAALEAVQDDDGALVGRCFRASALVDHPYGRPVSGSRTSIRRLDRSAIREHHDRGWVGSNVVVGLSGPLTEEEAKSLVDRHLGWLPRGKRPVVTVQAPRFVPGRRLIIVDKPDRSQTQVLIGTLGSHARDPDHVAVCVANTAFGGLFTSRLTTEVRSKRGWSYGASSGFGQQPKRDLWTMRTAPADRDAKACIALQLDLLQELIDAPLKHRELRAAKDYLIKSLPFEEDTAGKRLDHAIDAVLFELPKGYRESFPRNVKGVTRDSAHDAVRKRLSSKDQLIVVVATASKLQRSLSELPGLSDVRVIPFNRV